MARSPKADSFVSKGRLDALTDSVFAFAMTLLVINIELPEGFDPNSSEEFLAGLGRLADTFIAYIITFAVLASFWLGRARVKQEPETASAAYAWAVIFNLFCVTFLPFSMMMVGRYDFPEAVWIYGGNMILLSLSAIVISLIVERDSGRALVPNGRVKLGILIASALVSIALVWLRRATQCSLISSTLPPRLPQAQLATTREGVVAPEGEHQDVAKGFQGRIHRSDRRHAMQHTPIVEKDGIEGLGECKRAK